MKETLSEKKRKGLSETKPKKKKSFWGSMFEKDTGAINKRKKALDDIMNYEQ